MAILHAVTFFILNDCCCGHAAAPISVGGLSHRGSSMSVFVSFRGCTPSFEQLVRMMRCRKCGKSWLKTELPGEICSGTGCVTGCLLNRSLNRPVSTFLRGSWCYFGKVRKFCRCFSGRLAMSLRNRTRVGACMSERCVTQDDPLCCSRPRLVVVRLSLS